MKREDIEKAAKDYSIGLKEVDAADIWVEYTEPKQRSKLFNLMNKKK